MHGGDAYNIVIRKPEKKRPLERYRCRWANIAVDL
jgi:hypothetical protein